jgi:glutathione peroxidase-family protein
MKQKILYTLIHSDSENLIPIKKNISKLSLERDIAVITDVSENWNDRIHVILREPGISEYATFNKALKYAKDNGYEYCFFIKDCLQIENIGVFEKYIHLSQQLDLGVVMYGFGGYDNRVINKLPNPCLKLKYQEQEFTVIRFPSDNFILFKIDENMELYDENLKALGLEFILFELQKKNEIPFLGFYFDINESWKNFKEIKIAPPKNIEDVKHDIEYKKEQIVLESNPDILMNFIVSKVPRGKKNATKRVADFMKEEIKKGNLELCLD